MPARTPSTFRLIGAGVTSMGALAAIFGSGSNAETLANLDADVNAQRAAAMAVCDGIPDSIRRGACRLTESIKFDEARTAAANAKAEAARKQATEDRQAAAAAEKRIADHQKAGEASRIRAQCLSDISKALTANPPRITVAEARAAKTTPTPSDDPCVWRSRLQPQLGELSKR
jgi:hypothetical protein